MIITPSALKKTRVTTNCESTPKLMVHRWQMNSIFFFFFFQRVRFSKRLHWKVFLWYQRKKNNHLLSISNNAINYLDYHNEKLHKRVRKKHRLNAIFLFLFRNIRCSVIKEISWFGICFIIGKMTHIAFSRKNFPWGERGDNTEVKCYWYRSELWTKLKLGK